LNSPVDYGSGVEWAKGLISKYNTTSLQLGETQQMWYDMARYSTAQHYTIIFLSLSLSRALSLSLALTHYLSLSLFLPPLTLPSHSGLWLVGSCEDIVAGKLSKEIKKLSNFFLSIYPTTVYLRVGYEFDSFENNYNPVAYGSAYRTIVDSLRLYGVQNVAYVWHSYSDRPQGGYPLSSWYPGERWEREGWGRGRRKRRGI
jgi:hypothetical protein